MPSCRKPHEASHEECMEWLNSNGTRNPISKRSIRKNSKVYNELVKKCGSPKSQSDQDKYNKNECESWILSGKKVNPKSNRKISPDGKVYKKIEKDCEDVVLTKKTPYKYQEKNIKDVINVLKVHKRAINVSEMGTGKTLVAIKIAKSLDMSMFVLCPKAVRQTWYNEIKQEEAKLISVTNFESIRGSKKSNPKCYSKSDKKINCKYVTLNFKKSARGALVPNYEWSIPKNTLVVIDESHKAKNSKSSTSRMVISLSKSLSETQKLLMLSATPIEVDSNIKYLKEMLMVDTVDDIKSRILRMKIDDYKNETGEDIEKINIVTKKVKISKSKSDELEEKYDEILELRDQINTAGSHLAYLQKLREEIEILKVDTFISEAEKALKLKKSVIVFVNFKKTLKLIQDHFEKKNIQLVTISGQVPEKIRQERIHLFQTNKVKLVIITVATGGTGINLQDKSGDHPRVSIISPSWSMTDLVQTFGRTERVLTKSKPEAYIIFAGSDDNSVEFKIADTLKKKLVNLGELVNENLQDLINLD